MSEIPFVELLGDELEAAARRSRPSRPRRRRRFVVFGLAGALVLSGTAVATGVFSGDDQQRATTPVSCYEQADAKSAPTLYDASPQTDEIGALSPVELCRRELETAGRPPIAQLVACAAPASVAVIPGTGAADCSAAGFAALSAGYSRARLRSEQLEREILRIEAGADCIAPARLARRVQALLDSSGWTGWRAAVRGPAGRPCATVSNLGGGGRRSFGGSLDAGSRSVIVWRSASRRLTDLLFAKNGLMAPLFRASGARCFSPAGLRGHVEQVLGANGVDATLRVTPYALREGATLSDQDGRRTRYREGCAIVSAGEPGSDEHSVVIEAWITP